MISATENVTAPKLAHRLVFFSNKTYIPSLHSSYFTGLQEHKLKMHNAKKDRMIHLDILKYWVTLLCDCMQWMLSRKDRIEKAQGMSNRYTLQKEKAHWRRGVSHDKHMMWCEAVARPKVDHWDVTRRTGNLVFMPSKWNTVELPGRRRRPKMSSLRHPTGGDRLREVMPQVFPNVCNLHMVIKNS